MLSQPASKGTPLVGMRTIKTVIAVFLSALVLKYVLHQKPFFACIGAIVAMERNISDSLTAAIARNIGTLIGGLVGILIASFTESLLLFSLGLIPLIVISNRLHKQETIVPGAIVYFAVCYLNTMDYAWVYGLNRILGTFVGSLIGLGVNLLLFPPKVPKESVEPVEEVFETESIEDVSEDVTIS